MNQALFTEQGLPAGATFSVVYDSIANSIAVTPTATSIYFTVPASGNYPYTISNALYNGANYIPANASGYLVSGSATTTAYGSNQLISIPGCAATCLGVPTTQILSQLNNYILPNVSTGTIIGLDDPVLGVYGSTVVVDCDPVHGGPVCLVEFNFNSEGTITSVYST
jgi:hypothetical protein